MKSLKILLSLIAFAPIALTSAAAPVRFAAFGDYGYSSANELAVSTMVKTWSPDFIITTGDNSYGVGPIDNNIGQYYHEFIGNYAGGFGAGSVLNRYFPSIGNHEYSDGAGINAYLSYFTLPGSGIISTGSSGNERYYDFRVGPVHFFAINSDPHEPDGVTSISKQALWLQTQLGRSTAPWKIVYMHHAPFSSCTSHGSQTYMQWPFEQWGASAVLAGHDHTYERIMRDDNFDGFSIPYFVTGLGGYTIYNFPTSGFVPGSAVRYNGNFGSMLIDADDSTMILKFYSITAGGTLIDSLRLYRGPGCCVGATGDINGVGIVDLSDLSALVSYLDGNSFAFPCETEANVDTQGIIDLADLSALVSYLTNAGYSLPACP